MEIIARRRPETPLKAAILDFDGTISLIREGWQGIMIPFFVEVLAETPGGKLETESNLEISVREFVELLTGKQTIYQCLRLAEEVAGRGGVPWEPLEYKHEYHRRLFRRIEHRLGALRTGADPEEFVVPGSYELLDMLRRRGMVVYLASGTDEAFVRDEADLLGVTNRFNGGIYGARDDHRSFSKALVIRRIIEENSLVGPELVGFGDGYVEIENVREVGGFAVGVASNESERKGVDPWKRNRLIAAGADWIIPDYRELESIETALFS